MRQSTSGAVCQTQHEMGLREAARSCTAEEAGHIRPAGWAGETMVGPVRAGPGPPGRRPAYAATDYLPLFSFTACCPVVAARCPACRDPHAAVRHSPWAGLAPRPRWRPYSHEAEPG